jgi:hypothetical protein
MKELRISGREGIGKRLLVDDDIYQKIKYKELKFKVAPDRNDYVYYTEKKGGKFLHVRIHRMVMGCTDSNIHIDHIDTDPLNCQRENLRPSTRSENNRNRNSFEGSSSEYKGVVWDKEKEKWRVQIGYEKRLYFIGYYKLDEEEIAAENFDYWALKVHKDFALLNFPGKDYENFVPRKKKLKGIDENGNLE